MKGMILAAGEGTRLRPLTLDCPKPMLPIKGQPLLEHTIAWLRIHGVQEIAINLHHQPRAIPEHFGDGREFEVKITYSMEGHLLGTAGAVKRLERFFDQTFVVIYGDVLTDLDLTAMATYHRASEGMGTIALYRVDNPIARGLVEMAENGRIVRFVEKPRPEEVFTDLANSGVYILEPEVLEPIPPGVFYDFGRDLFPALLERGTLLYGYPIADTEYLIDIGSPESYERAQREWAPPPVVVAKYAPQRRGVRREIIKNSASSATLR
jgi:NDP-sugar pyrophosphorylase family protein